MEHWSVPHVGAAAADCGDFVRRVMREQFGRDVRVPPAARTLRGRERQFAAVWPVLARRRSGRPEEGDAVLMAPLGCTRGVGMHLGVWCAPPGGPRVLHAMDRLGGCLHRPAELARLGLRIEGVYEWI